MPARYAASYIESPFETGDLGTLHQVVSVVEQARPLPEEFWLFCRVFEWTCSQWSDFWQYYEALTDEKCSRISAGLRRLGLRDVAEIYCSGRGQWRDERKMMELDKWLRANARWVETAMRVAVQPHSDLLKHEN